VADAPPVPTTATVLRAVDSDTIDVLDDTRGPLRIRLLGIDTPEVPISPGRTTLWLLRRLICVR